MDTHIDQAIAEITRLRQDVDRITAMLVEGNNGKPVTVRLALLEQEMQAMKELMEDVRNTINEQTHEMQRGRWNLIGIALAGLFSLASAAIALMKG